MVKLGVRFYYLKHFIAFEISGKEDPVRLVFDNHESQLSIAAFIVPNENDISFLTLPPHTSPKLRPLNCTICGPYGTYGSI